MFRGFALPASGIEAFTLEGDSGRVPLTHHRYMTIKAGWLTRFLVDTTLNSYFTVAIRATIVVLH
jgi:hypothetical protein